MNDVTFPLLGEALILDLVNTRPHAPTGPVDLLATPAGLAAWLAAQQHRIATQPGDRAPTRSDLDAVHAVRDHAATAIDRARRGTRPPAGALRALTAAQRDAPAYRVLDWDGTGIVAHPRRSGPFGARLAAQLAESATALLTDPELLAATRQCQGQDCVLLFTATHPRRQWCSAARCGNRARVARYYQRHRHAGR